MWQIKVLTLAPEIYPGSLGTSVVGSGLKNKIWSLEVKNIRDYAGDRHKTVDSPPYGGGSGMLGRADVIGAAIDDFFLDNQNPILYPSPRGKLFTQTLANKLANNYSGLNILCGRFEGVDERVLLEYNAIEISIGDYVLSSGDVAAFPIIDCCVRLLPGVLSKEDSLEEESLAVSGRYKNLLEYPHYTKPRVWKNRKVPEVLLSGNHQEIEKWRFEQAKEKTKIVRPDLWDQFNDGDNK